MVVGVIEYFLNTLKKYPAFGVGAFRASRLGSEDDYIAGANFYVTTPTEFGFVGASGMLILFFAWIVLIRRYRNDDNTFLGFALFGWVVGLAGARLFAFHQPWFILSMYMCCSGNMRLSKVVNPSDKQISEKL